MLFEKFLNQSGGAKTPKSPEINAKKKYFLFFLKIQW